MHARTVSLPLATTGLLSLVALFHAHCELFAPLDGLSGGGDDAGTASPGLSVDGHAPSTPQDDAHAADAWSSDVQVFDAPAADTTIAATTADATTADVTTREVGSGQAVDATTGDSAALPPVASDSGAQDGGTVLFDDDFEGHQPLPRTWDLMATTDGTLVLDPSLFVSPTTSLRATAFALDAGAAGNAANVTLRKLFVMPSAGSTVAYDFSVFPGQYDTTNAAANAVIGALQISDGAGDLYELQLDVQDEGAGALRVVFAEYTGLADGGSAYVPHAIPASLAAETWTQIRIALDLTPAPVARVYFNGAQQIETPVNITVQGTAIQISLGLSYVSAPSDSWVLNYDDATFRLL